MKRCGIIFLLILTRLVSFGLNHTENDTIIRLSKSQFIIIENNNSTDSLPGDTLTKRENPRVVAAILCASLGLFGVHRMYLGTDVKVPVFYALTIGGGAVLWLVDLGLILFSDNIESFMDNKHVFMWKEK